MLVLMKLATSEENLISAGDKSKIVAFTCPTDKLLPSSSTALSNVKRGDEFWTSEDESPVERSMEFDFRASTRYERFKASQSLTSSCSPNGSRLVRRVPETIEGR